MEDKMSKYIDLSGMIFGRLTVLYRGVNDNRGQARWICRCSCGQETLVRTSHLKRGKTQSCGCLVGIKLEKGESGLNALLASYRRCILHRKLEFKLTKEEFRRLTQQNCYYCAASPSQTIGIGWSRYSYNGIDRVDNSIGYSVNNCVACCKWCNIAKSNRSKEDFLSWIGRIYNNMNS